MKKYLLLTLLLATTITFAKEINLNNPKDEVNIEFEKGDTITLTVKENGTTGFIWHANEGTLEHIPPNVEPGFCGAPGQAKYTITPTTNATILLEYKRPWNGELAEKIILNLKQKENKNVQKLNDLLTEAKYFFLATVDGDQPHLRPLGAHFILDDHIIFGVGDFKNVYKQLATNPKTEIVAMIDGKGKWLRYTGKAHFPDEEMRLRCQEETFKYIPSLRDIYNDKTGHKLMCFWLEDATCEIINMMPPGEKLEL